MMKISMRFFTNSFLIVTVFFTYFIVLTVNNKASAVVFDTAIDITPTASSATISGISDDGSLFILRVDGERVKSDNGEFYSLGTIAERDWNEDVLSNDGSTVSANYYDEDYSIHNVLFEGLSETNIESDDGIHIYVQDLSSNGEVVVGNFMNNSGVFNAFKYEEGVFTSLNALSELGATAYAVSGDGSIIVGEAYLESGDRRAFKYEGTEMVSLSTLGGNYSSAHIISRDGNVIAGESLISDENDSGRHAFKYEGTTMTDLGTLGGGSSSVRAISNDGSVIVGNSINSSGETRAFKYEGGEMFNLGALEGHTSRAVAISGDGLIIVGNASGDGYNGEGYNRAFKYEGTTITDLGTLGGDYSHARGISNDGKVITGKSQVANGDYHAFVYYNSSPTSTPASQYNPAPSSSSLISVNNTYASLYGNGARLNSIINLNDRSIEYALNQDATIFGENGLSFTAGTKYTNVKGITAQEATANVKVAYRFNDHFRAGVFLDQSLAKSMPDDFDVRNPQPLVGLFAAFSQKQDGSGLKAKVSGAYNSVDLSITRNDSLDNTEAGQGKTKLVSQGLLAQIAYGFNIANKWNIEPYVGVRRTVVERAGYAEHHGADFPITYEDLNKKTTTAFVGAKISTYLTKKLGAQLVTGYEHDLENSIDGYSGSIYYMGNFDLDASSMRRNRAVASVSGFYDVKENQAIGVGVSYAQQALNNDDGMTISANYTVGF